MMRGGRCAGEGQQRAELFLVSALRWPLRGPSLAPLAPCRRSEAARPAQHDLHSQSAATPSECQVIPRKIDFITLLLYCPLIYHDYSCFSNHAFFVSSNFVRKILQPAFHLIASEDDDMTPETTGREFTRFSETPSEQGTCFSEMSTDHNVGEGWTSNSEKLGRLGSAQQSSPALSFLIVKNDMGEKRLFVDLGVYTRNRNFRLYKSSKIGKYVALEVAEDNRFCPTQSKNISKENQYFLSSLVSNVRFSDALRILTCDIPQSKQRIQCLNRTSTSVETIEGFQCSPYPEIDQFVLSLVNKNGIKGGIRRWNYFFPEELLVYDICKYRWCENIGRAHRSNNIMILVDLKNEVWYQKCHDPVCKAENFKSDCYPLPAEVCLLFLLKEEEEFATDTTANAETKGPHEPSASVSSKGACPDADWDNGLDDTCILEATEDAELAEAAENSLLAYNGMDEIPDELLIEVLQE
ncbi:DNA-directed primase/polymerase protein isoform X5 [Cervus elaphus]|uniref:DNA-directed primase/polymerase protein isoform X5 n=1 Tax=Cervus elaphus TaxID=9860 RepID=UPI001CC2F326|nr:DNA-directed primase/polymerase protein isoform X5 [Cervus elaphus]